MEGNVELLDAGEARRQRNLVAVDLFAVGDDARDGAEAARHAHRLGVGEVGKRLVEQLGIKLVGFAIDVEECAGETRCDHRHAERGDGREEVVDEAVLGLAQRQRAQPRKIDETLRVDAPRMG